MTILEAHYDAAIAEEIRTLASERNAVVLAHNYQRPEIQDVADYVGDSLGLSREAAKTDADVIVFCGVHFMAETAAILSPKKTVLLPDLAAGCSLAATIDAEQLRQWKSEHPNKQFVAANDRAQCAYMKVTTLPKVRDALLYMQHQITVPEDIALKARVAIERMVSIGGAPATSPFGPEDPGE